MSKNFSEKNLNPSQDSEETTYDSSKVGDAAILELLNDECNNTSKEEGDVEEEGNVEEEPEKNDREEMAEDSDDSQSLDGNENSDSRDNPTEMAGKLLSLAMAILKGDKAPSDLLTLLDAAKAAEAVEAARKEGEIIGRNATIEERLRPVRPVIPTLKGSTSGRHRPGSIFDIAAGARS